MSLSQLNLRGLSIDLKMNNLELSGNITEFKTLPTRPRSHRDILIYIFAMESVKFVVLKHFGSEFLHDEPCCYLDVSIYMLKCAFC